MMETIEQPIVPRVMDILCGSGTEAIEHPGSQWLRFIVTKHVDLYVAAKTKQEKTMVSTLIFNGVIRNGSRFLKKDPIFAYWYDVGSDKVGRDKITYMLRRAAVNKATALRGPGGALPKRFSPLIDVSSLIAHQGIPGPYFNTTTSSNAPSHLDNLDQHNEGDEATLGDDDKNHAFSSESMVFMKPVQPIASSASAHYSDSQMLSEKFKLPHASLDDVKSSPENPRKPASSLSRTLSSSCQVVVQKAPFQFSLPSVSLRDCMHAVCEEQEKPENMRLSLPTVSACLCWATRPLAYQEQAGLADIDSWSDQRKANFVNTTCHPVPSSVHWSSAAAQKQERNRFDVSSHFLHPKHLLDDQTSTDQSQVMRRFPAETGMQNREMQRLISSLLDNREDTNKHAWVETSIEPTIDHYGDDYEPLSTFP